MKNVETMPPIAPAFFFNVGESVASIEKKSLQDVQRGKYALPHYSWLVEEDAFADVHMAWHPQGLVFSVTVNQAFEESRYPQFEEGDSCELFIDTRDMKQATYAHRFCHHFVILPVEVYGVRALEITRLRADDQRPLCDAEDIGVDVTFEKKKYRMKVELPASCLYGFDPAVSSRIGFTYRINRAGGPAQHFSVSSHSCAIPQYPALWASIELE